MEKGTPDLPGIPEGFCKKDRGQTQFSLAFKFGWSMSFFLFQKRPRPSVVGGAPKHFFDWCLDFRRKTNANKALSRF